MNSYLFEIENFNLRSLSGLFPGLISLLHFVVDFENMDSAPIELKTLLSQDSEGPDQSYHK
jgi:hypothetical protein